MLVEQLQFSHVSFDLISLIVLENFVAIRPFVLEKINMNLIFSVMYGEFRT